MKRNKFFKRVLGVLCICFLIVCFTLCWLGKWNLKVCKKEKEQKAVAAVLGVEALNDNWNHEMQILNIWLSNGWYAHQDPYDDSAARIYVLTDEENRELTETNEKEFYEAAEAFGLEKPEAEGYFQMLCQNKIIQNGIMELRGLVIDDFDQNGQKDIAVMVQEYKKKFLYGTGCIYFYMNGEKVHRFCEEWFPFFSDFYAFGADLDSDGYTELVFGARGTGCGGSGDWYNRILKYKNHTMERMEIPTEETKDEDCYITVRIEKDEKENTYRAYCAYLDEEVVFEASNPEKDYDGFGHNHRGFYDVQCVEYEDGYALQASVYLYGRGIADGLGEARFLIVWDKDGSSHFEDWWIEPYDNENSSVEEEAIASVGLGEEPVMGVKSLEITILDGADLSFIENMSQLTELHIEVYDETIDLSPLGGLVNLRELSIDACGMAPDISFLKNLNQLPE